MGHRHLSSEELECRILGCRQQRRKSVALLPVGSTEQHGPVLPIDSDTIISAAICDKLASQLNDLGYFSHCFDAVFYSPVKSSMDYAGSVTVEEDTFRRYVKEICGSLFANSFDAIVIVSGHGPADPSLNEVAFNLVNEQFAADQHPKKPVLVLTMSEIDAIIREEMGLETGRHAGWREFLFLYKILGTEYFTSERMESLRRLDADVCREKHAWQVLGVPLRYRSHHGVIGRPLPASGRDLAGSADRMWNRVMTYYVGKTRKGLGEFFQSFE